MADEQVPQPPPDTNKDEIADYYEGMRKMEMQEHENGIKKARNALWIAAVLTLVGELISIGSIGFEYVTPLVILVLAVEVGLFVALALWTKTKPYTAIIVGIILMIAYWGLAIWSVGSEAAYKGVIMRVVIIAVLISALKPAKAWEEAKKNSV